LSETPAAENVATVDLAVLPVCAVAENSTEPFPEPDAGATLNQLAFAIFFVLKIINLFITLLRYFPIHITFNLYRGLILKHDPNRIRRYFQVFFYALLADVAYRSDYTRNRI
jgi:hypothetical protein